MEKKMVNLTPTEIEEKKFQAWKAGDHDLVDMIKAFEYAEELESQVENWKLEAEGHYEESGELESDLEDKRSAMSEARHILVELKNELQDVQFSKKRMKKLEEAIDHLDIY